MFALIYSCALHPAPLILADMGFTLNREELAWSAGFFDGEGTIGLINASIRKPNLQLSVRQVRREPLDRFQKAVGVGTIGGPYKNPHGQDYFAYRVNGHRSVQTVVAMLWAFLSEPKREQAHKAMSGAIATFAIPRRNLGPIVHSEVGEALDQLPTENEEK